jgi:hypothetical protein
MQLAPYVERFGKDNILVERLETMERDPQGVLDRVSAFLDLPHPCIWRQDQSAVNVSTQRIRRFPLRRILVDNSIAVFLRHNFVPKALREIVKDRFRMHSRPALSAATCARLRPIFDADHATLCEMFPHLSRDDEKAA